MGKASRLEHPTSWWRVAVGVGLWIAFAAAAHGFVHRYLFDVGPVPGPGLVTLGVQVLVVGFGALLLLAVLRPPRFISFRVTLAVVIWVALIVAGHYLSHLDMPEIRETLKALREAMGVPALIICALLLALMLGVPFVPSVEMGLLVMAVFGSTGALAAWLATIGGLSLAFAAGSYMPTQLIRGWLERHGLYSAQSGDPHSILDGMLEHGKLSRRAGGRIARFLLRHRYLLFAALINMPGNSIIGGGGGIALICGFSRLYRWQWFLLTTALASLPIPLAVFIGLLRVDDLLGALGG